MIEQGTKGSLTGPEKSIVKYLVQEGWTNQNIQALVNLERPKTINSGRISGVKDDASIESCSKGKFDQYLRFKRSFDLKTGLNPFVDERLIKSREAMKLAVSVFNNPLFQFRAENFTMLANVAWTYLALEYSARNDLPLFRKNGKAISLSDFISNNSCPFSDGVKSNLKALIKLRDATEHTVLGPYDEEWVRIFQANCLNYEEQIIHLFGIRLSLSTEISFALQFSGMEIGQVTELVKSELPGAVKTINADIFDGLTEQQKDDLEFQFSVVYTTIEISNVLVKQKPSAITHPYKPSEVVQIVNAKTNKPFKTHHHTTAWKRHKIRPDGNSNKPEATNIDFCYYNPTFKSYAYNDAWVELLVSEID